MISRRLLSLLLATAWLLPVVGYADPPVKAEPETFLGSSLKRAVPGLRLAQGSTAAQRSTKADASHTLPALNAAETSQLQHSGKEKALKVGVGRTLPASLAQWMDLAAWNWQTVSGGQAARFNLTSSGALRVRAQLHSGQLPVGVELRVYNPADTTQVFGPYTQANTQFWSSTVEGETLALELFLPEGVKPQDVQLAIPQLSHLVVDPAASSLKSDSSTYKIDYSSCQVDIACASSAWQATGKAVARYVFTDTDGLSRLCSGTLLSDQDTYTQVPYFLTAAHCVSNSTAAGSMDFFWHYQNATCGGSGAGWTHGSVGAQLLASRSELDSTLVRLNNDPPAGVTLSGWTTTTLSSNQAITGIHHASGGPKKYSEGNFQTRVRIENSAGGYAVIPDSNGSFSAVVWSKGITAPGSSGSGVWVVDGGVHYLNGSLLGGSSDCANTDGPDEYSRFELFFAHISFWLATAGSPPSLYLLGSNYAPVALREGVIVARYLQGSRGNALLEGVTTISTDTAMLETKLAALVPYLDIDGDGTTDAATDASLLIRYLLGLRGAPLLQGLDLGGAVRTNATQMENYLVEVLSQ